jgi:tRNA A-37 threonylcarbamoyl transferase component Bud32
MNDATRNSNRQPGDAAEAPTMPPPAANQAPRAGEPSTQDQPTEVLAAPEIPEIPGYDCLEEIGRGAMGVVYKARQEGLNRPVALKMLLAGEYAGAEQRSRFRCEAEAVARLSHPHVVQVYEIGECAGRPFLAMEYVGGGTLAQRLGGTPLPAREAAALVETLARAVQAAHAAGIVHRDLKPGNVLLLPDGTPKVSDFGLAKRLDGEAGHTATGAVVGTPSYMAPEQAAGEGKRVGPAADVYALGAILYECLTGRPPFRAAAPMETILQVIADEPVSPRRLQPALPRDLETICLRCLEKDPARRYDSAAALAEDLRRFQAGEPIRARAVGPLERLAKWGRRHPARAAVGLLLGLVLVVGGLGGGVLWLWLRAEFALKRELEAKQREAEARQQLEQHSYLRNVDLAFHEWKENKLERARYLLKGCPEPLRQWEWYLVNHLCQAGDPQKSPWALRLMGSTKEVIPRSINCVAFSPDGERLASACSDQSLKVWDTASGREALAFEGHSGAVSHLTFSPDGKWLASTSQMTVKAWELVTAKEIFCIKGPGDDFMSAAFSRDGQHLASASANGLVLIWDLTDQEEPLTLRAPNGPFTCIAFSHDATRLAGGYEDGKIKIWDVPNSQEILALAGHTGRVNTVAFSPDGQRLASGCEDGTVKMWDAITGQEQRTLRGHAERILCVAFSPDGQRLASAAQGGPVLLGDTGTGHLALALDTQPEGSITSLIFSPDGRRLAGGGLGGTVTVWDAGPEWPAHQIPGITR